MTKLSVLLYLDTDTEQNIKRCTDSICENSGLPAEQIQIIVLDPHGDGRGAQIAESLPVETVAVDLEGMNAPQSFNKGIVLAKGEYLSFLPASSWYAPGALKFLEKEGMQNLLSLRPEYCEPEVRDYGKRMIGNGLVELEKEPWNLQVVSYAYFVRREFLGELRFQENLQDEAAIQFVLELLSKNGGRYWYEDQAAYCFSMPLADMSLSDLPNERWWYEQSVQEFLIPFMKKLEQQYSGEVPVYLQSAVYYILCAKYKWNLSGNDKLMLNREETLKFFELCCELLVMIDNEVIYQNGEIVKIKLPRALRMVFLKGKAERIGCQLKFEELEDAVCCSFVNADGAQVSDPVTIGNLNDEVLNIQVMNYRDGMIEIDGFFQGAAYLDYSDYSLYGKIEGEKISKVEVIRMEVYSLLKCFGLTYAKKYAAHIKLPVEVLVGGKNRFSVYVEHGGVSYCLKYKFTSINSRLLTNSQRAYWKFDRNRYVLYRRENALLIEKNSVWGTFKRELPLLAVLLKQKYHREALTCVGVRLGYWLTLPFYRKKRIWVTFDKLYKAGDNGEYFFKYCEEQKEGIDCYYVINRDAPDYERLKKEHGKHILIYDTWRCRFTALHAEAVMATHAGTAAYLSFRVPYHKYFKDLYQADNVCIQHGLSIQKIANFQNRLYANTRLYCLASPFERDNVAHPIYGYEPEMLKMTGLARYDGLKSKEKKQILITPTWRKNVVHTKGVGMTNEHSSSFKETAYYHIYNSLINDEKLIACAKKLGYRVIFLLHPAMSAQMDDYDRNDYVELMQATGDMSYEQILTESSLMVTDYSGVQFDFAYQRKPVVYYHPDELPPHYTEGGLIYSTMGFGPICTNHKQIVSELCTYMEHGCQMEDEYKERADKFFAFDDFNSAQRIYQEVVRFESEK